MIAPLNNIAAVASEIGSGLLPDNKVWKNRFEIQSTTSDRCYVIAQRRSDNVWGCSCTGWRHHRKCKHVTDVLARLAALANQARADRYAYDPEVAAMLENARVAYLEIEPAAKVLQPVMDARVIDL